MLKVKKSETWIKGNSIDTTTELAVLIAAVRRRMIEVDRIPADKADKILRRAADLGIQADKLGREEEGRA